MEPKRDPLLSASDLGSELLNAIFCKLGPSPIHLAPIPSVCKAWRAVMEDFTWKQLCLSAAPALCAQLKYDEVPPSGGWRVLHKFLFYCPGISPVFYKKVYGYRNIPWFEKVGHVVRAGFMTGPDLMLEGLHFQAPFLEDNLLVSHACAHNEYCGQMFGCRGLIMDFPNSRISAALSDQQIKEATRGTREGQERQRRQEWDYSTSLGRDGFLCAYCREPLSSLPAKQFFAPYSMSRSGDEDGHVEVKSTEGYVCRNGHLILGILARGVEEGKSLPGTGREMLPGTGQDLPFNPVRAVQKCRLHVGYTGADLDEEAGPVVEDLNYFSLSESVEAFLAAWESDVELKSVEETARERREPGCSEPCAPEAGALTQLIKNLPKIGRIFEVLGERVPNTVSNVGKHLLWGSPKLSTTLEDIRRKAALRACQDLRLEKLESVLEGAGVQQRVGIYGATWPDEVSVRRFVEAVDISVEDVIAAQRSRAAVLEEEEKARKKRAEDYLAQRQAEEEKRRASDELAAARNAVLQMAKCAGHSDGTSCQNVPALLCSHAACRKCCQTYEAGCKAARHRNEA